ncbi:M23 family metallopeptidase [Sphingobium sp. AN558]|uniref:M23 family metallopeptidase n=1 Tax=Sphingobium sp. AN558 TaxID=3133442 RepID=UPI0030BDE8D9
MNQQCKKGVTDLWTRVLALCPEREIFLRSGAQVRFFRLSRRAQLSGIACLSALIIGCATLGGSLYLHRNALAQDQALLAQQSKAIAGKANRVAAYRKSVDDLAHELEERQDFMDDLYRTHFGTEDRGVTGTGLIGKPDSPKVRLKAKINSDENISMAPEAAPLMKIDARQRRFASALTAVVERRADKAEAAIRSFGLNPAALAKTAAHAQGGPFVPWRGGREALPEELEGLAGALARLEFLETSLISIPSGRPTVARMETSSYGYRRDPFNGHAAFHAGIDFPGSFGQPILAAAKGRVSFVGQRQGYGNVVEVDHGNGLMTRYAHLSGFVARTGAPIARGEAIGRMGSTGRSTGTHLHFEVRLHGQPINPRRFLEAAKDTLQVQQLAKARFADIARRG